jgi:outer membrane protein
MGKIGWLNVDTAVLSTDEGKKEFADIQKFVDDKTAEMNDMRKEYDSLKNQLSVQGSKLTDEARSDLEYQISEKDTQLQRFQQDTQKDINNKRDRAYNYIIKRMQPVIEKLAKDKGLSAVLVMNPSRDVWVDSTLDITDDAVKAYNATYPVNQATPPSPPAAKP